MRVLSLGAGVQSSAILLMACHGELELDAAIFADTQWEPKAVYDWLGFLQAKAWEAGINFYRLTVGNIRADTLRSDKRVESIPTYLRQADGSVGMGRRECTKFYKITPIRRWLRESGATARRPADLIIGISLDELHRARSSPVLYARHVYPLLDKRMTRADCIAWLEKRGYPQPVKSACVGCPFRSNREWRSLTPDEWADAVDYDARVRTVPPSLSRSLGNGRPSHRARPRSVGPIRRLRRVVCLGDAALTVHRKRPAGPTRPRTAAEWRHSEWCLVDDDLRDLYVGGRPQTGWERYGASLLVLVVLAIGLVAWLVWGGRT